MTDELQKQARSQAMMAWQEAWWGNIPHTQFHEFEARSLRWYW